MPPLTARDARAPFLVLVLLAFVAALLAAPGAAEARSTDPGADRTSVTEPSSLRASRALQRVRDALDRGRGDATMALRDLTLLKGELTGGERAAAERRTSRPSGLPKVTCSEAVCVHYTTTGANRATHAYAKTARDTVTAVHNLYVGAGYRAPKPDGNRGGNALTDIYIGDIGDQGLYGYCNTDEQKFQAPWNRWAYCVLDNDYATDEFPTNTPLENLQVTAAHEYFHAVQFAYDYTEDGWFLEATAAWVEDEVFDDVDDNVQYLRAQSPLKQTRISMDKFGGLRHYGAWIFFRYLTERFPAEQGGMPTLVRDMIRKTDTVSGPALYSWRAVGSVLQARGTTAADAFAAFSAANRRPGQAYDEGRAQRYPVPPVVGSRTVARQVQSEIALDHLAAATYRYVPASALAATTWKLRLRLDLQPTARGAAALVTTYLKSGKVSVQRVKLSNQGNGTKVVRFSRQLVKKVELTLVNTSGRFDCNRGTPFSCSGKPKDNDQRQLVSARPVR